MTVCGAVSRLPSVAVVRFSPVQGEISLNPELDFGSGSQLSPNLNRTSREPDLKGARDWGAAHGSSAGRQHGAAPQDRPVGKEKIAVRTAAAAPNESWVFLRSL